jgi:hypothetical protein
MSHLILGCFNIDVVNCLFLNKTAGTNSIGIAISAAVGDILIQGNRFANSRSADQALDNTIAFQMTANALRTLFVNNNLTGVTRAAQPGSAYNGGALPGDLITPSLAGAQNSCLIGFNIV